VKNKVIIAAVILVLIFVVANRFSNKQPASSDSVTKQPQAVSVKSAGDSQFATQTLKFPAIIAGENEATITAKASGTVTAANFELGKYVWEGASLVTIDDTGSNLYIGDSGFRASAVQQSQLSKDQAKEGLDQAKRYYKDLKKAYNDGSTTVTKAQVNSAKEQIDIAEIQYDSAKIGYKGTLDNHLITSPISGYVISKLVSIGDSVSVGQTLAIISKTMNVKAQFFVSQEELPNFKIGTKVTISKEDKNIPAVVIRVSPVADPATKRFLIETRPQVDPILFIGTLSDVSLELKITPKQGGDLLLPLSAVTIGQNESYIFINDNSRAKKINVMVVGVQGELAEIKGDIPSDAQIILTGSKLVKDGDEITVTSNQ
jgi:RND family efflux transporter MFP subunit